MLAAARRAREDPPLSEAVFELSTEADLQERPGSSVGGTLRWHPDRGWTPGAGAAPDLRDLLDLYQPLITASASRPLVIGHLGQSLDGFVATASGDSDYVNGPENILHLHRLRALSDAVVVGAGTVAADDPRLTTRLASGDDPCRVILDPYGRLSPAHRVFTDGASPTLVIRAADAPDADAKRFGRAEILSVPARDRQLDLAALLATLRARALHVVFVEGGGATVSGFLQAGLLDRLQLAVAPLLVGEGRPGIRLPASPTLRDCVRPSCRIYRMGADVLFDCDLRTPTEA